MKSKPSGEPAGTLAGPLLVNVTGTVGVVPGTSGAEAAPMAIVMSLAAAPTVFVGEDEVGPGVVSVGAVVATVAPGNVAPGVADGDTFTGITIAGREAPGASGAASSVTQLLTVAGAIGAVQVVPAGSAAGSTVVPTGGVKSKDTAAPAATWDGPLFVTVTGYCSVEPGAPDPTGVPATATRSVTAGPALVAGELAAGPGVGSDGAVVVTDAAGTAVFGG